MKKKINLKIFSSKKNIEIQSFCYGLNLFLPTLILFLASIFREYALAGELGILIGVNIIFTQIFSANLRSIIISENNTNDIYSHIIFRFIISVFVFLVNIFVFYIYDFTYYIILLQITLLILIQWQCELILTYYEIKNKLIKFLEYFIISLLFTFFIIFNFISSTDIFLSLIFFNILFCIFLINGTFKMNKKFFSIKKIFLKIIKSTAFFSSLTISLSNLVWRVLIFLLCGKVIAGIYFACFAVGSLPGTFFNNSFGPPMVKMNLKIRFLNYFKYFCYLTIGLLLIISLYNNDKIFFDNQITQLFGTSISLLGSIFMIKGLYFRQFIIQKTDFRSKIFSYDVLYSIIICLIVPTLFLVGGVNYVILSFLTSSVISFLMYKYKFMSLKNKKIK